MGCWSKYVKPAVKELRKEITKQALTAAGRIVQTLDVVIADGRITKAEAGALGASVLSAAFGLTAGAAQATITIAVRTFGAAHEGIDPGLLDDEEDDTPEVE